MEVKPEASALVALSHILRQEWKFFLGNEGNSVVNS